MRDSKRTTKRYTTEKYEQPEESDVSDMEVTDDEEEGLTWEQLKEEMKTKKNETVSDGVYNAFRLHCELQHKMANGNNECPPRTDDDNGFEVVDKEDEDSDEELEWTPYTFENVEYLVGPEADLGRVVLETEDYQPVGVFEDEKIVFEDNLQVADHFQRVRESTIPEDWDEAQELLCSFIEDNYKELKLSLHYSFIVVYKKGQECPYDPETDSDSAPSVTLSYWRTKSSRLLGFTWNRSSLERTWVKL